ncbi:PQQ-binding-like beta-propeller repeat protein [Frigoribacterium endophyticum]|uniref:outer membrane protein assembly factor BamB family protein n=1 Tax=Frigoribacterium endophyticum TaxID=1522176 RepID=UPI0014222CD2|nr:PQQ-binding-like beta-propeller repeat protein [Frigoribacterium endophyticum]NII50250.1 outer membrane protein assembly factor BamB [Frigoribacterium endophyticum]
MAGADGTTRARTPRPSPMRRVVVAALAVVAASALVAVGGTAASPRYADGAPWGGTAVDDLRNAPTGTAWSLDLAERLAPGVPRRCLHFWPSPAVDGLVAVGASVDLDPGTASGGPDCRRAALDDGASRVALVDSRDGRVRWVHDLADDLDDTDPLSIPASQVVPAAGRVLVQTQTTGSTVLVALDLVDGRALESTRGRRDVPSISVSTVGRLQLRTSSGAIGSPDRYSLVDAAALDDPVWEGRVDAGTTPQLLPDGLLIVVDGRAVRVDGRTGEASPSAAAADVVATAPDGGDDVAWTLGRDADGRRAVSAIDADGDLLWSVPSPTPRLSATDGCVLTTDDGGTTATCLDPRSGQSRWTTELGAAFSAAAAPGQVGGDLYAVVQSDDGARLTALAAADGRVRWRAPLGVLDEVAAASRTVVYVRTDGSPTAGRGLSAYDAATGARLWSLRSDDRVSFWGGGLVSIDGRGVATRLVDRTSVVAGLAGGAA